MTEGGYRFFRDSVIVAIADEQEPPGLGSVIVADVCVRHSIDARDTWILTVSDGMEKQCWGQNTSDQDAMRFLINGAGLAYADAVRQQREPRTLRSIIVDVPRSDWIAIGAFLISLVALIRGG